MDKHILSGLRIGLGFIFLWAFIDKAFGLGFATEKAQAWFTGGSPTYGFLTYASKGPFALFFQSLAGNTFVDVLFMFGLLGIGISLLTNYFVRIGAVAGIVMVLLMYLAVLPPENNPIIDDHIIYAGVLALIAVHARRLPAQDERTR